VRHEIAIYTASSATAGLYDPALGRAGGAEVQMTLLARALSQRGYSVSHIIYPPSEPVHPTYPVTLVARGPYAGDTPVIGVVMEAKTLWRALGWADPEVVIVRTASPALGVVALFCKAKRRRLIFSSSNVSDFDLTKMRSRLNRWFYRLGARLADAVVVQSSDQIELAQRAFGPGRRLVRIPSFAERGSRASKDDRAQPRDAFLWIGRLVEDKRPLEYVRLARSIPDARFRMVVVANDSAAEALADLRTAAAATSNLELLEPLPRDQLAGIISSSVAVVNTSVLEGMPNVFLEAWLAGVPVLTLTFDPDGIVERHGLGISARGSWDGFVEGARKLWASRDDRRQTATRVRAYVERTHSAEAVASQWDELIAAVRPHGAVQTRSSEVEAHR
jgi:glycosyltransferase involved in cell wall biosynthesis